MSFPEKKKRKKNELSPMPRLTSLPEDLILSCFARVSILYYPTLSLVSKRFRSLLASPELYKTRSLLGHTENCLYVCIQFSSRENSSWFTLCRKPDQTLTSKNKKKSSGYVLAKVPIHDFPFTNESGLVAVGSSIYNICHKFGSRIKSSSVSILDCTSHTWCKAPSLPVDLYSLSASVLDRKIYVVGHYYDKYGSFKSSLEVFDTKTQIWNHMPFPCIEAGSIVCHSACIDGKFIVPTSRGNIAYDSKEGRWDMVVSNMEVYMYSEDTYCVVDNVLYSSPFGEGMLRWYDTEVRRWIQVKGLVGLPYRREFRVANYGGKMVVLWEEKITRQFSENENWFSEDDENEIWCAQIAFERRKDIYNESWEIWGIVDWIEHVLTIPNSIFSINVLAAIL